MISEQQTHIMHKEIEDVSYKQHVLTIWMGWMPKAPKKMSHCFINWGAHTADE